MKKINKKKYLMLILTIGILLISNMKSFANYKENFKYGSLPSDIKNKINGISYKADSPVAMDDLSYVEVLYWGFDDKEHKGELIVNKKVAKEVTEIFKELYNSKFPIEKIKLIDEYNGNDEISMSNNNTYCYSFRSMAGSKTKISNHAYGIAIDINPIQNPYIKKNEISPKEGMLYKNRKNEKKGMIIKGNICYKAFKNRGWSWGGDWKTLKDYQHFEKIIK